MREEQKMKKGVREMAAIALCAVCAVFIVFNVVHQTFDSGETESSQVNPQKESIWSSKMQIGDICVALQEAVLGNASEQKKLEVYTQEITDITKVTDKGALPFGLSEKYQYVQYTGTATYTVDLAGIDEEHISVDEDAKTITLTVPHTQENLDIEEEQTDTEETEKVGILAVGDPKMSEDERKTLILEVREKMEAKLEEQGTSEKADEMARTIVAQIYQPFVTAIDKDYQVKIAFE